MRGRARAVMTGRTRAHRLIDNGRGRASQTCTMGTEHDRLWATDHRGLGILYNIVMFTTYHDILLALITI